MGKLDSHLITLKGDCKLVAIYICTKIYLYKRKQLDKIKVHIDKDQQLQRFNLPQGNQNSSSLQNFNRPRFLLSHLPSTCPNNLKSHHLNKEEAHVL